MKTLSYSEDVKGWISFYSFIPDAMLRLNNRFFSVKDGQLYLHDQNTAICNNFYNKQYDSSVTTIFNESPDNDKIFKTIVQESSKAWKCELRTNYTHGTIEENEFNARESRWFSYIRNNEDQQDLRGHSAQGIGVIVNSTGTEITFTTIPNLVSVGDGLYQLNGNATQQIGTIVLITGNRITVDSLVTPPISGLFCYAKKDSRIEGAEIRGYFMETKLIHAGPDPAELFAVNCNIVKSYI